MDKIVAGSAPEKFSVEHLKGLGFKSSGDRAIIPLLKDLGFLTSDGSPTPRYAAYRDPSRSRAVLGEALREAYGDLFLINENLSANDRKAIEGKFKSTCNSSDRVAECQAATFLAFLKLADVSGSAPKSQPQKSEEENKTAVQETTPKPRGTALDLRYTIEVHLPATKDIEVFNAIFKSLRENLLD